MSDDPVPPAPRPHGGDPVAAEVLHHVEYGGGHSPPQSLLHLLVGGEEEVLLRQTHLFHTVLHTCVNRVFCLVCKNLYFICPLFAFNV